MAQSRIPIQSKKHMARLERERLQSQYILGGTIAVFVLVFVMIVGTLIYQNLILPNRPVATVNGEDISITEFQARVRYQRAQLLNQYAQTQQFISMFGTDNPELTASFQNQSNQIQLQLQSDSLGNEVLNSMIDEILIRQEAQKRGITVTDAEIDEEIEQNFGYFRNGPLATATAFPTPLPTSTLSPQQLSLITPTPTPTTTLPVIENTPTPEIATPTPVLTPTATATPYTYDAFQTEYQKVLDNFKTNVNFSEKDLRNMVRNQLYARKLQAILTADAPTTQEQVWARHILVADEASAQDIYNQLVNGADWNSLVSLSTDTGSAASGGDLGWFTREMMVPEFSQAAFNAEVGAYIAPVQSQFGWHIIQVLGKEPRSLNQSEYQQLQQSLFQNWLTEQRSTATIERMENLSSVTPTEPNF
ncbi:MAG: hypothetical protein OHK0052_13510 [Anaerolineales bacterium]